MTRRQRAASEMERMENTSLHQVLALTRAIESAAAQGDWVRAAALGDERNPMLMSLKQEQLPEALEMIYEIMRIDRAVTEQLKAGKERLDTQHNQALQNIKAVSKYHATGML
jgi:flagellar protein FliT